MRHSRKGEVQSGGNSAGGENGARRMAARMPELPLFKVNAIEGLGFGVVDKIMIKFNQQWWQDETCFCFLWKETDRMNVLNQFPIGPMKVCNLFLLNELNTI